ncbi:S-layer homology domain-containing protein [Paenibacillus sp. GYB004]|uniref:S-layer homology domain-containing protein n=1 Tax=Paenibacillus sp. GYB004 TaxID=2994393 RepID=UPI002F96B643
MGIRGRVKGWMRQVAMLLIFTMAVGTFSSAFTTREAAAAETSSQLIASYDFNGSFQDHLGGSELMEVASTPTHGNDSSGFGTTVTGDTYWQWQSAKPRGGGVTVDVYQDISKSYSIGMRFSYDLIKAGYTKIIDYRNKGADQGFYFHGGKMNFYSLSSLVTQTPPITKDQIVDIIATRDEATKKFTAYFVVNGELKKEIEVIDTNGEAVPSLVGGKTRFGFFFDDTKSGAAEATTGGKVYSIKFWDGPITAEQAQGAMNKPADTLSASASAGQAAGTTKVTAAAGAGNKLVVRVSSSPIPNPNKGEAAPIGAGVTDPYTAGQDIAGVDAVTNKYVGVYEVDAAGKVVGFKLITLTSGEVAAALPPVVSLQTTYKEYTEGDGVVVLAPNTQITGGNPYSDGTLTFAIRSGSKPGEKLSLVKSLSPSVAADEVSVVGDQIFLGNGMTAQQIGSVSNTKNGQGKDLQIDLSTPLTNGDFSSGTTGWTITNDVVLLGNLATKTEGKPVTISGSGPYTVSGTATGGAPYSFLTDVNYDPNDSGKGAFWKNEGVERPVKDAGPAKFKSSIVSGALKLESDSITLKNSSNPNSAYGSVFGPDAISSPFTASAGSTLAFQWKAEGGGDDYEIYGYLVNAATNEHIELMYGRGKTQGWTTATGTIPADGEYKFRFVAGSYDKSGAYGLGAALFIDDVRVFNSNVTASVVEKIARLVTYENSPFPRPVGAADRIVDVTVKNSAGVTASDAMTVHLIGSGAGSPGGVDGATLWLKADKDAAADLNGQLTGWSDQTGTNQFAVKGTPDYKAAPANFNPAVAFQNTTSYNQNPNEYMIGDKPITFKEGYAVFKQTDGTVVGSAAPRAGGYGVGIFSKWAGKLWAGNGANGTYHGFAFNDASRFHMAAFDMANSTDSQGKLNGKNQPMTRNKAINSIEFTPVIGGTFGGGSSNNWYHYKGDIAEVVLYPASNAPVDKLKVESYLALKYGLTLNHGGSDYAASNYDGTAGTKMWTAADNTGYGKRITGIGRDDGSELQQKQSKSQEAGALVTIALGDGITAANAQNGNTIATDLSFFTFSDNGTIAAKYDGEVPEITTAPQHKLKQLNREFKVDKTNWLDTDITLKLDVTAETPAALYYLVIRDTAGVLTEILALNTEGTVKINSAKLADGSTFTFAKVTKDALQKSVNGVGKLTAGNYTSESWTALQNALTSANTVLGNPNATQKEIDEALAALEAAKQGLSSSRDKLEAKVNQIKSAMDAGTLKEGDYTADSWQALKDELNRANAVLAQTPAATEQELAQAITKLDEAKAALVDLSALRAKVNEIEGEGLTPSGYTATSWQALQDALDHAKNVLADPSATQAEVDRAKAALEAARAALVAVNKSALQAKVDEMNGETNLESLLTPESWEALKEAMAKAQAVLDDPDATQAEVDAALAALQAARQNAVIAGAELTVLDIVYADGSGNPAVVELSPAFDGKQYLNYTGVVPNAVSSVGLDLQSLDPNGQVQVTVNGQLIPASDWGNLPLREGRNVIEVEVTDSNGNKNKYTIEMMRVSSKLESLAAPGYGLNPAFQSDKEAYTMNVPYEVSQLPWTPVALDPEAKIEFSVNGGAAVTVASGTSSPALPLQVGSNTVTVKVTDRNGGVKEYVVTVYRDSDSGSDNGSGTVGGGTGIGGGTSPATGDIITSVNDSTREFATGKKTTEGGHTLTTVEIDAGKLNGILAQGIGQKLAIRVPNTGDVGVQGLMAEQVKRIADSGSSLEIGNLLAIYPVPGGQLDFNAISNNLNGAKLGDIAVHVDIKRSPESLIDSARSKATAEGHELLVDPVDLRLTFTTDGKTTGTDRLNGYAARYIALPEGIDLNRITTGVVINPDGTMFHLPTVVTKINNRYFALINDLRTSGTYSVIWNPKDFDDVKSHWARADISNIAARLDLAGTGNNTFSPDRNIIRSEFATIVATGMGLMRQNVVENQFEDVNISDWYHDGVSIASEFEIVLGYDDGLFHGGRNITREQGIAMIARAFNLVEPQRFMSPAEINATLLKFGDADNVSGWAREVVAKMVAAGIAEGEDGRLLNPQDYMSRAEAAALMRRLLQMTNLID